MKFQERISYFFTGIAYIVVAVLVITHPKFIYYWIAGIFVLQGAASILKGILAPQQESLLGGEENRIDVTDIGNG